MTRRKILNYKQNGGFKAVLVEVIAENKLEENEGIDLKYVGSKSDDEFDDSENEDVGNDHYVPSEDKESDKENEARETKPAKLVENHNGRKIL